MKKLVYVSPKGKRIEFDDFEDEREEYGTYWAPMCPHCHNKYKALLKRSCFSVGDGGSDEMSCGVVGCENAVGGYYVDIDMHYVHQEVE